jgi:DNA-binding NarL/FixJ family response regulator
VTRHGLDALIAIRTEFPDARVIVLTTDEGDVHILRSVKAGAQGYPSQHRAGADEDWQALFAQQASHHVDPQGPRGLPLRAHAMQRLELSAPRPSSPGTGCIPPRRAASSNALVSVRSVLLRRTYGRTY